MPRPRVLVTRRLPAASVEHLAAHCDVDHHTDDEPLTPEALRERLRDKHGVVVLLPDRIDAAAADAAPDLKVVANVAVGYDNLDVPYLRSRGIVATNTPDVLTDATADLTWALILTVTRRLGEGERLVRAGRWTGWRFDQLLGSSLARKQLGIVGPGRIGRAVAARAAAFGMRVACAGRRDQAVNEMVAMGLDQLLATSDIVSLHVPLTPETRHLIDRKALMRMKRTAYLVNTTRGPVVDEGALVWALEERLIAGAALDVYEREPLVHTGLLAFENVVLAPHLGSATVETRRAMADLAVRNVIEVVAGRPAVTPIG